ncbi:MAG: family 10 glycosylhydrolase [Clostridiaceae bacterium]|nr:family 10 glycosylhydrolase [Clostridiaceae bacterium]
MKQFKNILTIIAIILITTFTNCAWADALSLEDPLSEDYPALKPVSAETLPSFKPYDLKDGEILFNNSQKSINSIDPNEFNNRSGSYFPGARGVNQLVIYTPAYGSRTNTNEFGAEAIVDGNTVSELSGADSIIPQNGIVISGHGTAKNWMNASLKVGTKVYVDKLNSMIYTYTTSESYLYESEKKIAEAEDMINYYKAQNDNYNSKVPESFVDEAKNYIRKAEKNPDQIEKYSQLAINSSDYALKSVLPYRQGELKGVWVRPVETTPIQIEETLNRLKNTGIDNIFLETYFHGVTIYPSKIMQSYNFKSQNNDFVGFDPLNIWVTEAHKRGIKVHIWFETFYAGVDNPTSTPSSILGQCPSWGNKTKKDADAPYVSKSVSEHNGYFIDPANPEAQDFLAKLVNEIITTYHPDGINLDYIRYPQSVSKSENSSWGYTKYARDEFASLYGIDPATLTRIDPLWSAWENYRRNKVSQFVKRIGQMCKDNKVYLTTVIFPDRLAALDIKQQDWKTWSQNGYVNGFTPLFLTCDSKMLNNMMQDIIKSKAPSTDLYAGLFVTFMGGSDEDLIREIHEARKLNAKGIIIFDYAHLSDKYADTLAASVFASTRSVASTKTNIQNPRPRSLSNKKKKSHWFFLSSDIDAE